ncbi:MAG TPA: maleylpyruvate isomerase family mycothiol-dependent enzyme [Acidimicrobiales bacterium]|nr:maleylpyruvate isomerase family mycothiol-dependent enzyme [Acidimicrobiales bacterium]
MAVAGDPHADGAGEMTGFVTEALVSVETEPAPPQLRGRVLEAALASRPAGRPAHTVPLSPVEAYRRTIGELDELLGRLDATAWAAVVDRYGWTVQGLVGHLLAVERLLAARLGRGDEPDRADADHITMSLEVVAAQQERDPAATLHEWRATTRVVLDTLAAAPPDLGAPVSFHGVDFRWGSLLVARSLEVWTHADDVRAAAGEPLQAPDSGRLALMTDLCVRTLPLRLATLGPHAGTARIVLTGSGGGAWSQPLALAGSPGEPDVRLVADAVAFCRLSTGRLDAADLDVTVTGDPALAADILATAAAFAV